MKKMKTKRKQIKQLRFRELNELWNQFDKNNNNGKREYDLKKKAHWSLIN